MRREKIERKNKNVISGDINVAANEGHQLQLYGVATNERSLVATIVSPLMKREKIKIKNKIVISGDIVVAANDPSSAAILCCHRWSGVISGDFSVAAIMRREKIEIKNKKGH